MSSQLRRENTNTTMDSLLTPRSSPPILNRKGLQLRPLVKFVMRKPPGLNSSCSLL